MIVKRLRVKIPFKDNFIFLVFVLIFLLQAYMHNNNIVYIFIFFVLGIIINNYFLLKKNLKGLEFFYINSEHKFAKESSFLHIRVENKTEIDRYDIRVNDTIKFDIKANSRVEITIEKIYNKRGLHKIPTIKVTSPFPLYIFDQYYSDLDFDKDIIIYPSNEGEKLNKFIGSDSTLFGERDDFKGVRQYDYSDSLSQIHWKSLAKGKLMTKEYNYLQQRQTFEFDIQKLSGDIEKRLSQLTLWIIEADAKGYEYKVKLNNKILESKNNSLREILTSLALYS